MKHTFSLSALCCALATSAFAQDKTLTISTYSFAQDAYKAALYDPFEAICDCNLVIETGNSATVLNACPKSKPTPLTRSSTWP